ncbi:MAG: (d)CMP kinase [Halofilum sp. (in: g-proteobacteria)]
MTDASGAAIPVVCIDGPSGSGKGTLSRRVAEALGFHLLDSGALYRLTALAATRRGVDLDDEAAVAEVAATMQPRFEPAGDGWTRTWLDGDDVTRAIRAEEVGMRASRVAAQPAVRKALLALQRGFRLPPGLVADGRDMGSVVFPAAPLKIFLTASAEERARRRHKQLKDKGIGANLRALMKDIEARDEQDAQRAASPMVPAVDAIVIDSTSLSIEEVTRQVVVRARDCLNAE